MRPLMYATLAAAGLMLTACETTPKVSTLSEPTYEQAQNNAFNTANYNAVGELMKRYPAAPGGVEQQLQRRRGRALHRCHPGQYRSAGAVLHLRAPDLRAGGLAHVPVGLRRA
jgi:hypothetical protein